MEQNRGGDKNVRDYIQADSFAYTETGQLCGTDE